MKQDKYFWSHLVELESLFGELDLLTLSKGERKELESLAHSHLHQAILDTILSHLGEDDKKKFLELVVLGDNDKIWSHLHERVEKIEEKIKDASEQIKKELKEDIAKIKK